jgi:hypothetical protein
MRVAILQSVIASAIALKKPEPEPVVAVLPPDLVRPLQPAALAHIEPFTPKMWPAIRVAATGTIYLVGSTGWQKLGKLRREDLDLDKRIRELLGGHSAKLASSAKGVAK